MIKLIAIDIDGTILPYMKKQVPDLTRQALKDALDAGIKVAIVTGRSAGQAMPFVHELGLAQSDNLYHGALNGGQVLSVTPHKQTVEYLTLFEEHQALELMTKLKEHKLDFFAYTDSKEHVGIVSNTLSPRTWWMKYRTKTRLVKYKSKFSLDGMGVSKFIGFSRTGDIVDIEDFLNTKGYSTFKFSYQANQKTNIEINPPGVSKAKALQFMMDKYDIIADEIAFFGDGSNDVQALEFAGMGVAMKNASNEVKKHAKYVTNLNDIEGGVGDFIYKHILKDVKISN